MMPFSPPSILSILLSVAACSAAQIERTRSMGSDLSFVWDNRSTADRILLRLGFTNFHYHGMGRNERGNEAYLRFEAPEAQSNFVATVTLDSAFVQNLYGPAYDTGQQVCWFDKPSGAWRLANGTTLPATRYYIWLAKSDYIVVEDKQTNAEWVSRAQAPTIPLIHLPANVWGHVELFPRTNALDVFWYAQSDPLSSPKADKVLTLETYSLRNAMPALERRRIFPWACSAYDVDPSGRLAVLRPNQIYFARGILVHLESGRTEKLGYASDRGCFLANPLVRRILELEGRRQ